MPAERILVVDDIPSAVKLLQRQLEGAGYQVHAAGGLAEAIRLLDQTAVDLVVTDLRMPGGDGLELVRHVQEHLPDTEAILVTGYGTVEGAVAALHNGAADYVVKPYTEEELLAAVGRALARLQRRRAMATGATPPAHAGIVGESEAMGRLAEQIARAAATSATVLICGESGTGKELVAHAIHAASPRHSAPFIPINCGAIAESLLESELFGHVKGAFTGADHTRTGVFQAADGGTIFLDEIGVTSAATQLRLLRVLQEREISMVGSSTPRRVDVRVIAATNQDLKGLVASGAFREALFYRINVLTIQVPPLRDRGDDVLPLARHFAERFAGELNRPPLRFSDQALQRLVAYSWPGNVRELENLVQRLTVMKEGEIAGVADLPDSMHTARSGASGARRLEDVEAEHIRSVLASVQGNKARAARILGIDRKTLYAKLRRYDTRDL
jgi:two-component system response regulator HydG